MKSVGWVDLTVEGADALRDFYARVMGWRPEPVSMGDYSDYSMCDPGSGEGAAGICHARGSNAGLPPVWLVYFHVSDLEASIAEVESGGGEILHGPRAAGPVRFAVARDPAGTVFAMAEGGA